MGGKPLDNNAPKLNSWKWNELEEAALDELHDAFAEKLYLRGLRKHMDYGSGYVGIKRRVCYDQFIELLEELPTRRSHKVKFKPSVDKVRWLIKKLVEVGLVAKIKQKHRKDPLVFFLPLASVGLIRTNDEHHRNTIGPTPKQGASVSRISEHKSTIGKNRLEPHTSGISGITLSHTKKNILDAAWQYGVEQQKLLRFIRPDLVDVDIHVVEKFELNYKANRHESYDWDALFEKWVRDEIRRDY